MAYTNTYTRINWQNLPSEATALNDVNLNKMDAEIYAHGEQFETVDTALGHKVNKESGKGLSAIKTLSISTSANTGTDIASISYKDQNNLTVGYTIKNGVVVDSSLSGSSTNPVQNKVVKSALDGKSTVSIANTLPTGDTIANLTIDGTTTAIKAPLVEVDDEIDITSENPVQNKVIAEALREIMPEVTVTGNPISISDGSNVIPAKLAEVTFLPKQDLHGYDSPWVGGAGKNKLQVTMASYTWNGITVTVYDDGTVLANGTATGLCNFTLNNTLALSGNYILSGCPSGGSAGTFRMDCYWTGQGALIDSGNGVAISPNGNAITTRIVVMEGVTINNQLFKPMIRLATVADGTFAPYENKCPISGRNSVKLMRCGKNIVNEVHHGNMNSNGTYGTGNTRVTNATSATSSVIKVKAGKYTISAVGLDYATILTKDNYNNIVDNFAGSWHALPYTFTITQTANLYFTARKSDNTTITLADVSVQIEEGETATTYEPYQGETYTETLGQTVYGGNVDFVSGEGQIDLRIISENDFTTVSSGTTPNGYHWADVNIGYTPTFNISNMLPNKNGDSGWGSNVPCFGYVTSGAYKYMRVYCAESTIEDFKTAYAGLQIVFSLETPATLTLTPTQIDLLKGNNVLTTDGNSIKLVYSADIKAWVESQLSNS